MAPPIKTEGESVKNKFSILGAVVSLALITGCSQPTSTVIPSDIATWDKELAPSLQKLPESDRNLVASYLMRSKVGEAFGGKGVPPGTTVGQAIEAEKKFDAEQLMKQAQEAALKAKLQKERTDAIDAIGKSVTVTLIAKSQIPKDFSAGRYSDEQGLRVGIQNNSAKPMVGVAGSLKFIDVFDKEVGSVNFRISESIAPGGTYTWNGSRNYNQFMASQVAVWNLEEGKYTTHFVPEAVVFADGTKLTVPE